MNKFIVSILLLFSASSFAQNECTQQLNTGEFLLGGRQDVYICSYQIEYNNGVMYGFWRTDSLSKYTCTEKRADLSVQEFTYDNNLKLYVNPNYRIKVLGANAFEIEKKNGSKLIYMKNGF